MNRRSSSSKQVRASTQWGGLATLGIVIAAMWLFAALSIASRTHFVMGYKTLRTVTPVLELLAASLPAILVAMILASAWCWLIRSRIHCDQATAAQDVRWAMAMLAMAAVPLGLSLIELLFAAPLIRLVWEPIWLAGWTGGSFYRLVPATTSPRLPVTRQIVVLVIAMLAAALWWFWQSVDAHSSFQLGFNDFGHFGQRVANTAAGRGVLIESPVLPMFWDHFNPGLLLLVPLWSVWPDAQLFFAVQAGSLVLGAAAIWALARRLGLEGLAPLGFALAWLAQPCLGQMNLAYTYGWHPISLAMACMLGAMWALLAKRFVMAIGFCIVAMSMEEGVIAMVAIWSLVAAARWWLRHRLPNETQEGVLLLGTRSWLGIGIGACGLFFLVYRFSGFAEFQTGRFVALGNTLPEVIASPLLRPSAFWGQLLRPTSFAFVAALLIPCFGLTLVRSWSILLAGVVPIGVLLVWHHDPATCLAFQYPCVVLPVLWFAALEGTRRMPVGRQAGCGIAALVTGVVLSMYLGQLPHSGQTMIDINSASYTPGAAWQRGASDEDAVWMREQIQQTYSPDLSFLATGRIAAHLVGARDVETVGQFFQRQEQLAELDDRRGAPLLAYDWLILDRIEDFQQLRGQTRRIEAMAIEHGFAIAADRYDVVFLHRSSPGD